MTFNKVENSEFAEDIFNYVLILFWAWNALYWKRINYVCGASAIGDGYQVRWIGKAVESLGDGPSRQKKATKGGP